MNAYELADKVDFEPYGTYGEQAANMLRKQADEIYELKVIMWAAINSGDWKVDGACDPDMYLRDFEPRNEEV